MDVARKQLCGSLRFPSRPQHPRALLVVMVGLPGTGKSATVLLLQRYLRWLNHKVEIFNCGAHRRELTKSTSEEKVLWGSDAADFRDVDRLNAIAADVLNTSLDCLLESPAPESEDFEKMCRSRGGCGRIAFLDATNSTVDRRLSIVKAAHEKMVQVMFIETSHDNVLTFGQFKDTKWKKYKDHDFKHCDSVMQAYDSFMNRVGVYQERYAPIGHTDHECETSFLKLCTNGIQTRLIDGYMPLKISTFMTHHPVRVKTHRIYLCRHGESQGNLVDTIGGDTSLTERGSAFGKRLGEYLSSNEKEGVSIWTSTLKRTVETARACIQAGGGGDEELQWKQLDEIHGGSYEGKTVEQFESERPEMVEKRANFKYTFEYPGRGESYATVCQRLESVLVAMERQESTILIITHRAVLRMIRAYLLGLDPRDATTSSAPLHTLYRIDCEAYSNELTEIVLDV